MNKQTRDRILTLERRVRELNAELERLKQNALIDGPVPAGEHDAVIAIVTKKITRTGRDLLQIGLRVEGYKNLAYLNLLDVAYTPILAGMKDLGLSHRIEWLLDDPKRLVDKPCRITITHQSYAGRVMATVEKIAARAEEPS